MARRTPPHLTPEAEAERRRRLERLAAAMRENLRRRKAQLRARTGGGRAGAALVDTAAGEGGAAPDGGRGSAQKAESDG